MPDHAIFGGCLRSDIPIPELRPSECGTPDWTFRVGDAPAPLPAVLLMGEDRVDAGIAVRSYRLPDGFRLEFDDTGTYDVRNAGRDITWYPRPDARAELARSDLLGGVLSVALHSMGLLCLHGSGVALRGRAVGFLAPKGSGKSTLAMALTSAGGRFITDDMLPVLPGPPATVWPGAHSVRLLEDSAALLSGARADRGGTSNGKHKIVEFPAGRVLLERAPLAAVYELVPMPPSPAREPARRTRLSGVSAAVALVRHTKIGDAIGAAEAAAVFERAAAIAATVPVYALEVVRDFDRLDEVAARLLEWHECTPVSARRGGAA